MKTVKARGLVLKEYEAGESDKRLLVLCKEHGRMMIYARGARKPKSKFMAAAQVFTYADFVLAAGRGFYSLAQAEVIESFYGLRTDYDTLAAAHLIAEVCEKTLLEAIACDDLLKLALRAFLYLSKPSVDLPPLQVTGVFFLRFFVYYGLAPETDACTACGEIVERDAFFSADGLVCRICHPSYSIKLSPAAVYAVKHIIHSDLSKSFIFSAHSGVIKELWLISTLIWDYHFELKLVSKKYGGFVIDHRF